MYQVWSNFLNPGQIAMLGIVVTFLLTFLALKHPFSFLPSDHGREFAVNGGLSRGKLRGVGLVIVICFLIGSVLFLPLGAEYVIYAILLVCIMLSGYLDDASETPWSDYKKGAIDLVISIVTVITFDLLRKHVPYHSESGLHNPRHHPDLDFDQRYKLFRRCRRTLREPFLRGHLRIQHDFP